MSDPMLIADLIRAGLDAELVCRVSNAIAASADIGRQSSDKSADALERRRLRDREYQRKRRKKLAKFKVSEPSGKLKPSPQLSDDASADKADGAPLSILSSLTEELPKEDKKKEVLSSEPRAKPKRGTRLPDDWEPTATDLRFAADRAGLRLVEVEIEATKFRNYWTNRTDRQASKPRWDLAWQNWVLNVRKAPQNPRTIRVVSRTASSTNGRGLSHRYL